MTLDPSDALTHDQSSLRSAQGYYELGMAQDGLQALQDLSEPERQKAEVMELEILLLLDQKSWQDALKACHSAIELHPKAPFGYVNKAFALHELEETAEALKVLEDSHLTVAVEPTALYNRGCYLACLDRDEEAAFWINKTLRIEPRLAKWAAKDPDLDSIRGSLHLEAAQRED